ncbi:MAG: hypothetical protein JWQ32_562 [Marmoricola sp.]|nr:hypothetical protein [Marmoricola sp.]
MTQANVQETNSAPSNAADQTSRLAADAIDQASDVAATAKQQATDLAATAKEEATQVAAEARDHARALLDEGRKQADEQTRVQRDRLVGTLQAVGDDLEKMSTNAQGGIAADLTRQVGEKVRQLSAMIENKEPAQLLSEVRTFAQRKPGRFVLGALAAGVLTGRVLRGAKDAPSKPSGAGADEGMSTPTRPVGTANAPQAAPTAATGSPAPATGPGIPVQAAGTGTTADTFGSDRL